MNVKLNRNYRWTKNRCLIHLFYEPLNYPIQGILRPLFLPLSLSPLSSLSRNSLPEGTTIILTFESKHIRVGTRAWLCVRATMSVASAVEKRRIVN